MSGQSIFTSRRQVKYCPYHTQPWNDVFIPYLIFLSMYVYILYSVLPLEAAHDTHALLYTQHVHVPYILKLQLDLSCHNKPGLVAVLNLGWE